MPINSLPLPRTETEYRNALVDAAELGAMKALQDVGLVKPFLKLAEAKRMYGPSVVDRWIKEGLLKIAKDGNRNSTVRIDRLEIMSLAKTANRATYLTTVERR